MHSFRADTPVLMADGTKKPISKVRVGGKVMATDPRTGKTVGRTVTVLEVNRDTDLVDLTVRDARGRLFVLHTTQHHPFWDDSRGHWVDAGRLPSGERLHTQTGGAATVMGVRSYAGRADMRDLTIDRIHTYYVIAGNTPVLVHNTGPACGLPGHSGIHQFPGTIPGKSQFFDDANLNGLSNTNGVQGVLQANGNTRYVMRGATDVGIDRTTGLPTN
jgi:hypothetical protein